MAGKTSQAADGAEVPWHAALPCPETAAGSISRLEVLTWLKEDRSDFVLIDVRRMDCEGGMIRGSINLPAQSLYDTIPRLYKLLAAAKLKKIVWFCGSSRGRGPRTAGWFADYLRKENDTSMQSVVLEEGIKGWATAGEDYVQWIDGYEEAAWR